MSSDEALFEEISTLVGHLVTKVHDDEGEEEEQNGGFAAAPSLKSKKVQKLSHLQPVVASASIPTTGHEKLKIGEDGAKAYGFRQGDEKPNTITHAPPKEMTGVSEDMTRICAAVSGQIYYVDGDKTKFDLDYNGNKVEILEFVTHGVYRETIPPFVIVKTGTTMIVGWRGSSTLMDWTADFNATPIITRASRGVRIQSSFLSLIESDFDAYGEMIINLIKEHKVSEVIFTGHSLGGGLANVAHVVVTAQQLHEETSQWDEVPSGVTFRSIVFAAPMSVVRDPEVKDEFVDKVVDAVKPTTCNVIFDYDPVPRSYSMLAYSLKLMNAVLDGLGFLKRPAAMLALRVMLPKYIMKIIENKGLNGIKDGPEKERLKRVAGVFFRFRHLGKVVYYADATARPKELIDDGPKSSTIKDRSLEGTLQSIDLTIKKVDADGIGDTHNFLVTGPGLAYNIIADES